MPGGGPAGTAAQRARHDARLCARAGADLLADTPALAAWLRRVCADACPAGGTVVVGNYVYLDGAAPVRVWLLALALGGGFVVDALARSGGGHAASGGAPSVHVRVPSPLAPPKPHSNCCVARWPDYR